MAATITVVCPECNKEINAPADIAGKKVRCKQCAHVFRATPAPPSGAVARAPAGKSAGAPKAKVAPVVPDDDDEDANPYGVTGISDGARCPECANEMESPDAIICLHCGYNTITRERLALRKVHDRTGGDYVMWLLPGIICALGVLFFLVFDILYCVLVRVHKGDSWVIETLASGAVKMWICIGSSFVIFFMGKFAIKRLILHPVPPEIDRH